MKLRRIDSELVRRGLVRSRTHAQELIETGRVLLDGQVVTKPARQMDPAQAILILEGQSDDYVSRGAHKLAGALDALADRAPTITDVIALDAGASTGGFTDVLLRRGAAKVYSVDVGYGQLSWKLQQDERVDVRDRTNVRTLNPADYNPRPSLVVSDLSFISLTLVLPALRTVATPEASYLLMVKPQFEIGKDRLGHGGVVRNLDHHVETVEKVAVAALTLDYTICDIEASPLPGPSGNIEYFLHMRGNGEITERQISQYNPNALPASAGEDIHERILDAVRRGPGGNGKGRP